MVVETSLMLLQSDREKRPEQTMSFLRRLSRRFRSKRFQLSSMAAFSMLIYDNQSAHQSSIIMGLEQWPTQQQYIEAERESAEPPAAPPTNAPTGPIKIRWLTPSNYPGGRIWHMEELTFGPDESIFDRKIFENNMVYWSQDTRAHLTREATCASVSLLYA
jgi:hypothetical protein